MSVASAKETVLGSDDADSARSVSERAAVVRNAGLAGSGDGDAKPSNNCAAVPKMLVGALVVLPSSESWSGGESGTRCSSSSDCTHDNDEKPKGNVRGQTLTQRKLNRLVR